jgi:hypothetical protein
MTIMNNSKKHTKLTMRKKLLTPTKVKNKGGRPKKVVAFKAQKKTDETSAERLERIKRQQIELIEAKMIKGVPLSSVQLRFMEAEHFREEQAAHESEPSDKPAPGGPPDIIAPTHQDVAILLGVPYVTLATWRDKGIGSLGNGNFSMKTMCQALHERQKLRRCKPDREDIKAIRAWALGEVGSVDPDAPDHSAPIDWQQEVERQNALRAKEARKKLEMEVAKMSGDLIPVADVRASLVALREHVVDVLSTVLEVTASLPKLDMAQSVAVADALQVWISRARGMLASKAAERSAYLRGKYAAS